MKNQLLRSFYRTFGFMCTYEHFWDIVTDGRIDDKTGILSGLF